MVDGCSSRTETKQATDWIFRTLLPLPYTLMERYRTIVCGSKKKFQRSRGVKGTSKFARGSEAFLGLFNFYHIQKTVLLSNIRIHVLILIEDLYFMYMIILPKDFFQNSLINGFGVQSVLLLSICLAGYLVILQPVLSSVLWSASLLGVLGLTSQLCFLRDVLSMMTLHIYCFYVYAAR